MSRTQATTVFDFQDYKPYLLQVISAMPGKGRGFRSQIAETIGTQASFVTSVLQLESGVHLSLEQAQRINTLLGHNGDEEAYFLFLVQYSKSGTEELRQFFRKQMKKLIQKRLVLKNRLHTERELSYEVQAKYYSAWYYQAIRVAVIIPKLRTEEALSKRLRITRKKVATALKFLEENQFISREGNQYLPVSRHLQLSNDSAMRIKTHTNWRLKSLSSLDEEKEADLHYSAVLTFSETDALILKALIVNSIEAVLDRTKSTSCEETLYAFGVDFFEL